MNFHFINRLTPFKQQVASRVASILDGVERFLSSSEVEAYIEFTLHDKPFFQFILKLKELFRQGKWEEMTKLLHGYNDEFEGYPKFVQEILESNLDALSPCLEYLSGHMPEDIMQRYMYNLYYGVCGE